MSYMIDYFLEAKGDPEDYTTEIDEVEDKVSKDTEGTVVEDTPMGDDEDNDTTNTEDTEDYTSSSPTDTEEATPDDEDNPKGEEDTPPDEGEDGGDEVTDSEDYTTGGEDTEGETTGDDTDEQPSDNEETNDLDSPEEQLKNVQLHKSFVYIYGSVKQFMNRLDNIENSGFIASKIISRVNNNLITLRENIKDYIIYEFPYTSYTKNLYNYNQYVEAIRVNMLILSKTGDMTNL